MLPHAKCKSMCQHAGMVSLKLVQDHSAFPYLCDNAFAACNQKDIYLVTHCIICFFAATVD